MAGEAARVMVMVGADISEAVTGLKNVDSQMNNTAASMNEKSASIESGFSRIGSVASGILKVGAGAAVAGIAALGAVLVSSTKEAMAAEEVQAQLAAVLKSTGGASGMTVEGINAMAASLMAVTRFEDDTIIAGQNMLLTFKNIGSDVFPAATKAMLNMSTAMGQDIQTSAIQLGKALNDPVAGLGALSRVGIQFSDEQETMIKAMVAAGDTMGAQKVILAELETQFGGAAEAAGKTFAGQMDIMQNQMSDVKESIGAALLPALSQLATLLGPTLVSAAQQFGDFLTSTLIPAFQEAVTWVTANWPQIQATVETVFNAVATVVGSVIGVIDSLLSGSGGVMGEWGAAWEAIKTLIDTVVPPIQNIVETVFGAIADFLAQHGDDIKAFLGDTWTQIGEIIGLAVDVIQTVVVPVFTAIADFLKKHSDDISTYLGGTWEIIKGVIKVALDVITGVLKVALALMKGDWEGAWTAVKDMASKVWEDIKVIVQGALTVLASLVGTDLEGLKRIFTTKFEAIRTALTNIDLGEVGKTIIKSLQRGIEQAWTDLVNKVKELIDGLKNMLKTGATPNINPQEVLKTLESVGSGSGQALPSAAYVIRSITPGSTYYAYAGGQAGGATLRGNGRVAYFGGDSYIISAGSDSAAAMTASMIGDKKRDRMREFMGG